jgi:hypothetical protein
MTINGLIKILKTLPALSKISNIDIKDFGSDRGNYYDFYIGYGSEDVAVLDLIALLERCIGQEFEGYKGGDFLMQEDTAIKLSSYGNSGDDIDGILISCDYNDNVVIILKPTRILRY